MDHKFGLGDPRIAPGDAIRGRTGAGYSYSNICSGNWWNSRLCAYQSNNFQTNPFTWIRTIRQSIGRKLDLEFVVSHSPELKFPTHSSCDPSHRLGIYRNNYTYFPWLRWGSVVARMGFYAQCGKTAPGSGPSLGDLAWSSHEHHDLSNTQLGDLACEDLPPSSWRMARMISSLKTNYISLLIIQPYAGNF